MSDNQPESLRGRTFTDRSLRETRFIGCDLSDVVVRGSLVGGIEIDSPWLLEGGSRLVVNGVDIVPFVDAELNARFPGRELRSAATVAELHAAWAGLERTWAATLERAASMPAGSVEASVDGEWSLAQTLRHLVTATDTWLGRAILERENPHHPVGLPDDGSQDSAAFGESEFATETPSYEEVLHARADRQAMVRDFLAEVTQDQLAAPRRNPHEPEHEEMVLSCLRTILEEEWEHNRYAVRDLDALATGQTAHA